MRTDHIRLPSKHRFRTVLPGINTPFNLPLTTTKSVTFMKLLNKTINKSSNKFQETGINYLMWWNTVWRNMLLKKLTQVGA